MSGENKYIFHMILMLMLYMLDAKPEDELAKDLIRKDILHIQELLDEY